MTGADPTPRDPRVEAVERALVPLYAEDLLPEDVIAALEASGLIVTTQTALAEVLDLHVRAWRPFPEPAERGIPEHVHVHVEQIAARLREAQGGD